MQYILVFCSAFGALNPMLTFQKEVSVVKGKGGLQQDLDDLEVDTFGRVEGYAPIDGSSQYYFQTSPIPWNQILGYFTAAEESE